MRIDLSTASNKALVAGGVVGVIGAIVLFVKRRQALAVGEQVVAKLKTVLGTPYIWGSRNPAKGLDCSGAVVWALRELGLQPKTWNATAEGLKQAASKVILPQPGDLAFYGSFFGDISHVMVYMGDEKVLGASGGGPGTTTAAAARAKGAEVKVLPVDYRSDFRGYGRLPLEKAKDASVGGRFDLIGAL